MTPLSTVGLATGLTLARQVIDGAATVPAASRVVVAGVITTTVLLAAPDWLGGPLGALILTTAVLVHGVAVAESLSRYTTAAPAAAAAPATGPVSPTD